MAGVFYPDAVLRVEQQHAQQVERLLGTRDDHHLACLALDTTSVIHVLGHIAARIALQAQGCRVVPLRIDDQGIDVQQGLRECPDQPTRSTPGAVHNSWSYPADAGAMAW